jgi:hypothetical protein
VDKERQRDAKGQGRHETEGSPRARTLPCNVHNQFSIDRALITLCKRSSCQMFTSGPNDNPGVQANKACQGQTGRSDAS